MFIIRRDRNAVFRFTAIQSESGRKLLNAVNVAPESIQSIVLVSDGAVYIRSDAALKIAEQMDFPWNLLFAFRILPRGFRDWLYSMVSKHLESGEFFGSGFAGMKSEAGLELGKF